MERLIDQFWHKLNLPKTTQLNSRIYKKMILESAELRAADKKVIHEDIDTLLWRNTLKPETINIPKLQSDALDYPEIAVIQVTLKEHPNSKKRIRRLVEVMQRSIPYPLLLVVTHNNRLWLSLANKRQSLADREKLTIESLFDTEWIDGDDLQEIELALLDALELQQLDWSNYYTLYQGLVERVVALQAARHTGRFRLTGHREETLQQLQKLEEKQRQLRSSLKSESQFNRRLALNVSIKQCQQQIKTLTENL